jgi:hypothetical protein
MALPVSEVATNLSVSRVIDNSDQWFLSAFLELPAYGAAVTGAINTVSDSLIPNFVSASQC